MSRRFTLLASVLTVALLSPAAWAADARKASITVLQRHVQVRLQHGAWQPAKLQMILAPGDEIRTDDGNAQLTYGDGSVTRLAAHTTLVMQDGQARGLRLAMGRIWMRISKGSGGMQVRTPATVCAVTGTDLFVYHEQKDAKQGARQVVAMAGEFRMAADDTASTVGLLEGGVHVQPMTSDFSSGMLNRPGKAVWIASLNPQGLRLAQTQAGQDLKPGEKAICDQSGMRIVSMTPDEIAGNLNFLLMRDLMPAGQSSAPAEPFQQQSAPDDAPAAILIVPYKVEAGEVDPNEAARQIQNLLNSPVDRSPTSGTVNIHIE